MNDKQFIKYLITKYSEFKDYVSLISGGNIRKIILGILNSKDNESFESLTIKVLQNENYSKIDFHLGSISKEKRVQSFSLILSEIIEEEFKEDKDGYYENRTILERALSDYSASFMKVDDVEMFEQVLNSNQRIRFNKFSGLNDIGSDEMKMSVAIGGRYGVGKTVFSLNLIQDIINSNDNVCILYFGTSEINKVAFLKRFMTMTSNHSIRGLFTEVNKLNERRDDLQKILNMLSFDAVQSINHIKESIKLSKYQQIQIEIDEIDIKEKEIEKEISSIVNSGRALNIKDKDIITKKKSEISSLNLKKKGKLNILVGYLKQDKDLISVSEELFNSMQRKFAQLEPTIQKEETSQKQKRLYNKAKECTKNDFSTLKQRISEIRRNSDANPSLFDVIKNIERIDDFLQFAQSDFSKEILNQEVKNMIQQTYTDYIKLTEEEIKNIEKILQEEYDKSVNFLNKEHVVIEDKLNISSIETKLKMTRNKYPDNKIVFIIDYQQKVDGLGSDEGYKKSFILGEKVLDLVNKYNAFGVVMSQLKDVFKGNGQKNTKSYSYRPEQSDLRDGEGLAINIGLLGMIFNRDILPLKDDEVGIEDIDKTFSIYEIYFTKNRNGPDGYSQTRQYYIFDKKKITYLPVNKKYYSLLDKNKDCLYLTQLERLIKEQGGEDVSIEDILE